MGNFSGKDLESHDLIEDPNAPGYLQRRQRHQQIPPHPLRDPTGMGGVGVPLPPHGHRTSLSASQEEAILNRYGISLSQLTPEQREALIMQEKSRLEAEELRRRQQQQQQQQLYNENGNKNNTIINQQQYIDQHSTNSSTIPGLRDPNDTMDGMSISTGPGTMSQMDEGISVGHTQGINVNRKQGPPFDESMTTIMTDGQNPNQRQQLYNNNNNHVSIGGPHTQEYNMDLINLDGGDPTLSMLDPSLIQQQRQMNQSNNSNNLLIEEYGEEEDDDNDMNDENYASSDAYVSTVFKWEHGGRDVYITGTFNNWERQIPMHRSGNDFTYIHSLKKGKHAFKFVVDDEWRYAPDQPTVADVEGRINNFIDVSDFKAYTEDSSYLDIAKKDSEIYGKVIPEVEDYTKEPPPLPPHLRHIILNKPPPTDDTAMLPVPQHVSLNHLYCTAIKDGMMVLGSTQRFCQKYVTTVFYSMMPNTSIQAPTSSIQSVQGNVSLQQQQQQQQQLLKQQQQQPYPVSNEGQLHPR